MPQELQLTIDSSALIHNLKQVRRIAPNSRVLAMIKANAYGHGMVTIARALSAADAFGVACMVEAIHLRNAGIQQQIVLMRGALTPEELALAVREKIDLVIHQQSQIELLENQPFGERLGIWLKIDTGMHRLGFLPEQADSAYQRLMQISGIKKPLTLMTHFASAEDVNNSKTKEQIQCFQEVSSNFSGEKSLANSAGILAWPQTHADWVRPGIMLYGASPFADKTGLDHGLRPVMTWHAKLIAVHQIPKGGTVGYGGIWTCPETMTVGVVSIGYADGYPRHAINNTPVLVNNSPVALIGRVSMDMLTVDLRSQPHAKVGDPVTLWGEGLPVEKIALHADTNVYELLCNARNRT